MPKPGPKVYIPIDAHRSAIIAQVEAGTSYAAIIAWLHDTHGITIGLSTFKRRLQTWGLTKNLPQHVKQILLPTIRALYNRNLDDEEIVRLLRFPGLNRRHVAELRVKNGMLRHWRRGDKEVEKEAGEKQREGVSEMETGEGVSEKATGEKDQGEDQEAVQPGSKSSARQRVS